MLGTSSTYSYDLIKQFHQSCAIFIQALYY